MGADRRTLTRFCWALVILVVISAGITLIFRFGGLLPPPDENADFVDQLLFMRTHDEQAFPFVVVGSLATLGVYVIAAILGALLRAWTAPSPERDVMTLLLLIGGVIGVTAQLANIGVGQSANPFYCDCGYKVEEVVALDRALGVGWSVINWLNIGAITLVGLGAAQAGRIIEVSPTWRWLSYLIAAGLLIAVGIRVVAAFVFIQAFDPFQVSDLIVAAISGILVPIWAILLARGIRAPQTPVAPAA